MLKHIGLIIAAISLVYTHSVQAAGPQHALALHGTPKYSVDFERLDYVNPDAPQGGTLRQAAIGTFDNFNPYIVKGIAAGGLSHVFESLTEKTLDEAFTEYALLAETIDVAEDRSTVTYILRSNALWHDGQPVTAQDVKWTFETLRDKGHPFYRSYYSGVDRVEVIDDKTAVFFISDQSNRELPLIIGQMPVLPEHDWKDRDFSETTLQPPLGSGPYRITEFEVGRKVVYEKVKDWWGKDLPINKGRYNFQRIEIDYYRDATVALEALLSRQYDYRLENVAKQWHTAYDHPAVEAGELKKEIISHSLPSGMQAFVYNTRRAPFDDILVREALAYAFDFEWSNRKFAFDAYKRTDSYFENSELEAVGLPTEAEFDLLQRFKKQLPDRVFMKDYEPPKTDGSGQNRENLRQAMRLLREAGWTMQEGILTKDGQAFEFEILTQSPMFERWIFPFIRNLKKLGITATLRTVDSAQYQSRFDNFDFDMTISVFGQSLSPGNEQYDYWGSEKAHVLGSRNLMGIKNPVVDALIGDIVSAETRDELVTATHALDRVLLWHHYVIPHWHINVFRLAYWDDLGRPDQSPPYGLPIASTWWKK